MAMLEIEWDQRFETGIASVDFEHRELIKGVNRFLIVLASELPHRQGEELLGEIFADISAHFALEERKMRAIAYDEFDLHKADHERLLDDIRDIMDAFDDAQAGPLKAMPERLTEWFLGHFSTHDARLHGGARRGDL